MSAANPVDERPLPWPILVIVGWFGIAVIEGGALLLTWAAFDAVYGPCPACSPTIMDGLTSHRAPPAAFRFMAENTAIAAGIIAFVAVLYRRRFLSVVRIALFAGGLATMLFGLLFALFAVQGDAIWTDLAASVAWLVVGVAALQLRHILLQRRSLPPSPPQ